MKLAKLLCGVALGAFVASNAMAADLLYSAPAPQAVAYGGPYFGAKIGANWMDDTTGDFDGAGVATDTFSFDTGFTGSIVAGYAFGSRWGMLSPRVEVEAGYLSNDVDTVDPDSGGAPAASDGSIDAFYWFANLIFDIPMSGWGFTPFIGGGVGFANVSFDNVNNPPAGTLADGVNDENTAFAWNLTAGLSYDISRNVSFDVAYRFVQFTDVEFADIGGVGITSDDIDNHQVTAGVRVHL